MKRSEYLSFADESLLSSLDIQDWNLKSLSGEIFENIGQILSLAKFQIAALNPDNREEAARLIKKSDHLLSKAIKDLRNLARQLSPTEITQKGFLASVLYELQRLKEAGICETEYGIKGSPYRMDGIRELILFSILQSYIYRALYEEKAGRIKLRVRYWEKTIGIQICWQALQTAKITEAKNEGNNIIRKRANLVHATIREYSDNQEQCIRISIKRQAHDPHSTR